MSNLQKPDGIAALVERLRRYPRENQGANANYLVTQAADALERLTRPVGVEPEYEVWKSTDNCNEFWSWESCDKAEYDKEDEDRKRVIYSAETVARLIAERDEWKTRLEFSFTQRDSLKAQRDTLQSQVNLLRDALITLQSAVGPLIIRLVGSLSTYQSALNAAWNRTNEALAATEPKAK